MFSSRGSSAVMRGLWASSSFGSQRTLIASAGGLANHRVFNGINTAKLPSTPLATLVGTRGLSSVGLWRLRPYASSSVTTSVLNPLMPGMALTSLSLLVAPPAQIAQFAVTIPTVLGASYATILAGLCSVPDALSPSASCRSSTLVPISLFSRLSPQLVLLVCWVSYVFSY